MKIHEAQQTDAVMMTTADSVLVPRLGNLAGPGVVLYSHICKCKQDRIVENEDQISSFTKLAILP